jgi:hypothetical protein
MDLVSATGQDRKVGSVCRASTGNMKQKEQHLLRLDLGGAFVKTRARRSIGCDDGLEVVAFPSFLLAVAIGSQRGCCCDLLGLVYGSLLNVGAIHHGEDGGVGGKQVSGWGGRPLNLGSRLRRNGGGC